MNIDQIAEMVDKNMRSRIGQKNSAEEIIKEELPVLEASMKRLEAEPIVKDVFKSTDAIRIKELEKENSPLKRTITEYQNNLHKYQLNVFSKLKL